MRLWSIFFFKQKTAYEIAHRDQHEEGRQHDEFALRKIDGLGGLPQKCKADCSESVDAPGRQTRNEQLDKVRHGLPLPGTSGWRYQRQPSLFTSKARRSLSAKFRQ